MGGKSNQQHKILKLASKKGNEVEAGDYKNKMSGQVKGTINDDWKLRGCSIMSYTT